ncbi:hypothetical protein OB905_00260 [Halobacteria archaeon AArc-dxtr1]|nr:hypothetical protein [Halobacteria archaeon AArc-dxtr1]
MNLDELRTVQSKERRTDSLQQLRPSFYQEVGDYIADLEAERDRAAAATDDPFASPEVSRLTDEIETAKDVVEAIYERRMGKLVKQASLAAAGMSADAEGLTAEEEELFETLVGNIRDNKGRVLDVLEGATVDDREAGPEPDAESATAGSTPDAGTVEPGANADAPPVPPEEPPAPPAEAGESDAPDAEPTGPDGESAVPGSETGVTAADVMGGEGPAPAERSEAPADPTPESVSGSDASSDDSQNTSAGESQERSANTVSSETGADIERVTVRITRDVGSILGVDEREYTLSNDDVVTLPERNATPLVERDAAEALE